MKTAEGKPPQSYRQADYAYGAVMLTLRTAIGLTQDGLARHLGVSRQAVIEWEAGACYPKTGHLKAFIALAVKCQAWQRDSEAEEIRKLWSVARQKVLLDERWLAALLARRDEKSPIAFKAEAWIIEIDEESGMLTRMSAAVA